MAYSLSDYNAELAKLGLDPISQESYDGSLMNAGGQPTTFANTAPADYAKQRLGTQKEFAKADAYPGGRNAYIADQQAKNIATREANKGGGFAGFMSSLLANPGVLAMPLALSAGLSGLNSIFGVADAAGTGAASPLSLLGSGDAGMTGVSAGGSTGGLSDWLSGIGDSISNNISSAGDSLNSLFAGGPGGVASDGLNVGQVYDGAVGGASPLTSASSGIGNTFADAFKGVYGDPTALTGAGAAAGGAGSVGNVASSSGGLLSKILGGSPLSALARIASIAQLVKGGGQNYKGATTQQQTQDQIAAQKAAQNNLNKGFIASLNAGSGTPYRTQTNPGNANGTNYYTYGQHPSESFFTNPDPIKFNDPSSPIQNLKRGGLPKNNSKGGQDDNIPANLSTGEFVVPADVVSGLGDGSTDGGASALHTMMKQVRKHKSSKGGLPPAAKSPLQYMKSGA